MFGDVVVTELLKLRRTRVTWGTLGAFSLGPLSIGLFMWIVREPGRAAQLGLLGAKANLTGLEATWPSCLSMLTLIVGMGGMILLAFVVAYVFGREYVDGTAKDLLVLPVGRHWIVLAKLVVAGAWWLVLVVAAVVEMFGVAFVLGLPGFTTGLAVGTIRDVALVAGAAFLLAPPVAWITVLGRGYLPPLGFAIVTLVLGDVFIHTGWAPWFPWSVVPMFVGAVGERQSAIAPGSAAVVAATCLAGIAAVIAAVRYGDNVQ
jgi:ABC-type transport system involved in multi-copper enzyme maturation permease subunit